MLAISKIIRSHSKIKELILLFLLGFFLGGIIFFLFQKSYIDILHQMDLGVANWAEKETPFIRLLIYTIYEQGKYFVLLWLLSATYIAVPYMIVFVVYKGFGYGFLFSFFISIHGVKGIMFSLGSLFPQALLLIPMYLFLFQFVYRGKKEKRMLVLFLLSGVLIMACFLEAYFNIPLMRSLYS